MQAQMNEFLINGCSKRKTAGGPARNRTLDTRIKSLTGHYFIWFWVVMLRCF